MGRSPPCEQAEGGAWPGEGGAARRGGGRGAELMIAPWRQQLESDLLGVPAARRRRCCARPVVAPLGLRLAVAARWLPVGLGSHTCRTSSTMGFALFSCRAVVRQACLNPFPEGLAPRICLARPRREPSVGGDRNRTQPRPQRGHGFRAKMVHDGPELARLSRDCFDYSTVLQRLAEAADWPRRWCSDVC